MPPPPPGAKYLKATSDGTAEPSGKFSNCRKHSFNIAYSMHFEYDSLWDALQKMWQPIAHFSRGVSWSRFRDGNTGDICTFQAPQRVSPPPNIPNTPVDSAQTSLQTWVWSSHDRSRATAHKFHKKVKLGCLGEWAGLTIGFGGKISTTNTKHFFLVSSGEMGILNYSGLPGNVTDRIGSAATK